MVSSLDAAVVAQTRDAARARENLDCLARNLGEARSHSVLVVVERALPSCADPDMALNNLERFFANPGASDVLPELLAREGQDLETLVQLFATSQYFSDLLIRHPGDVDCLRVPLQQSPSREELIDRLQAEVDAVSDDHGLLRTLRRFRQRQILRIGTNDVIRNRSLEEITLDIARVAEAALEVALRAALNKLRSRHGEPLDADGMPSPCVILAFGKLGGEELNYSSDIDLMVVYRQEGMTAGRNPMGNDEFYPRVVTEIVRLLNAHTEQGQAYRVDLRLRPEGQQGPLARSVASTIAYYDTMGRTWERQALIKLRPVAGDFGLGTHFLQRIEPFVYHRYLSSAEINGIKALKRRVEKKATQAGTTDVKTGHGGIRDIEFAVQFLQLLNGGEVQAIRQRNTLLALRALDQAGCLTDQEYHLLEESYRFLRKTEHRLQLLFDLQTHRLPEREEELRKLALRMGYTGQQQTELPLAVDPLTGFLKDYQEWTSVTRRILDHLLHETFAGEEAAPESDLILDSHPDEETIERVLGRYSFRDMQAAYRNLVALARESVPFLSTRRCRHFLAGIAPQLLRALAEAPDPDMALANLEQVTASLGGKAVLWELFSVNPPSLKLFVDLCASSRFLSEILIKNPGMIDELLDSLVLDLSRSAAELRAELAELCHRAVDPDLILHSFRDKELLRIGVRDILGKDSLQETTKALSCLAEVLLERIVLVQEERLKDRFGHPTLAAGAICRHALLGLGKLGGREMGYQSDLDLVLLYEGDGQTQPSPGARRGANIEYFTELAQRIIRASSHVGPMGRLYQVDMRLRPLGNSGSLVVPLAEFRNYFSKHGGAQVWERLALTRARVVFGDDAFSQEVSAAAADAAFGQPWHAGMAEEILAMRKRLERSRGERNLKRGVGGVVDIEFLVQMFQLKYACTIPALRTPNIWQALDALRDAGLLSKEDDAELRESYEFLRLVESRLRIVHNRSLDDLPDQPEELDKLARRLGREEILWVSAGSRLLQELERHTSRTRLTFLRLLDRERTC